MCLVVYVCIMHGIHHTLYVNMSHIIYYYIILYYILNILIYKYLLYNNYAQLAC